MAKNAFVGTWRLVSFELRGTEVNQVSYPFGKDAVGYIMYSEDGYVSVSLMAANRSILTEPSKFVLKNPQKTNVEEVIAAFCTYFSCCGKYEIQENKVLSHVKTCSSPNWVGLLQERFFELNNDKLSLSGPFTMTGDIQRTVHLVWQRLSI